MEDNNPRMGGERSSGRMSTLKLGGPKFEIAKFDGRMDYLLWERQVKGILKASGLGGLLREQPDDVDSMSWRFMQEQAVNTIMLYLQPHVIKQMGEYDDCASFFSALQEKYHQNELSNRLYTSLKLITFKMKHGTTIREHVEAFNDLVVDLTNLGEDLSEERKALHLLGSLPASYQSLSRVLLHREKKTITLAEVTTALLTDDLQQKLVATSVTSSSSGNALVVQRGRPVRRGAEQQRGKFKARSRSRSKSPERKSTCWKCGKPGHMRKDCRSREGGSSSANVVIDEETDLLDDQYML